MPFSGTESWVTGHACHGSQNVTHYQVWFLDATVADKTLIPLTFIAIELWSNDDDEDDDDDVDDDDDDDDDDDNK